MKSTGLHCVHRSFAHSAGAAVIALGAVLTSALPVAAQDAPQPESEHVLLYSCQTTRKETPSFETDLWRFLFGPRNTTTTEQTRCGEGTEAPQEDPGNLLRPVPVP
ncbi:hypothetical protein [Streptomyces venetus]|uniref:hypothetical protein n=1 Tax=Streptomyces venetus TaxID=1701086 RepID=UPI0031E98D5C